MYLEQFPAFSGVLTESEAMRIATYVETPYTKSGTIVVMGGGGMDTAVMMYLARYMGYKVEVLHINYGQVTESQEATAVRNLTYSLGAGHNCRIISIPVLSSLFGKNALTDPTVRLLPATDPGYFDNTNIPARNLVLGSIGGVFADRIKASQVWFGFCYARPGYHPLHDTTNEFLGDLNQVMERALGHSGVSFIGPFKPLTKPAVVILGEVLRVPWQFSWSCWKPGAWPCGVCGTCQSRRSAFETVGIDDPAVRSE